MTDLKRAPLLEEEARWLVQFIDNARAAGVLWRIGVNSKGEHVVSFVAGANQFTGEPAERLDVAIRKALDELLKAAKAGVG
jgi:hypothetical protein